MGEHTKIEWCDHTFNPWIGCTEMSPACDHCYARTLAARWGWAEWGAGKERHRTKAWNGPEKWNATALADFGRPARVFCLSLGDWADSEVPDSWRDEIEAKIDATPNLEWLLLSKRHTLVYKWASARKPKPNVRLGFTVENEEWARHRLVYLSRLALKGWRTFVSYEPALGPVNWPAWLDREGLCGGSIHWLICGGESGAEKRPMNLRWARMARDAAKANGVPYFFKQVDKVQPIPADLLVREFP